MGIVAFEVDIVEGEGVDGFHLGIEDELGKWSWLAGELEAGLVEVVAVEVEIAEGVDEIAGLVIADLGDEVGEECVGGDVEGYAEEQIRAALVELAGQAGFAVSIFKWLVDVELEKQVAGRECHVRHLADVPCGDDVAAGVGVAFEAVDEQGDLVDDSIARAFPSPPLLSVDGAELAVFVGPFVPDGDAVFLEIGDVGLAFEEPQQLVDDGAEVEFFRGDAGEAFAEIVARLPAEDGERAGAGAVAACLSVFEDVAEEGVVGFHGETLNFKL